MDERKRIATSNLGTVQETMMIPLLGRAMETRKQNGIIKDPKSVEIVEKLDYDFSRFSDKGSRRSMLRTTTRTVIMDRLVRKFIEEKPASTIVELGCGLNTRFERVDNGALKWFDLDMPDIYEIWKQFFRESERKQFLPFSAFDATWMEKIAATQPSSLLIISEASVIYFPENQVKQLFVNLSRYFPKQHYLFDSASPEFVKTFVKHDALKYCNARFSWAIDKVTDLKKWDPDIKILQTIDLEIPSADFSDLYSASFVLKTRFNKLLGKAKAGQYQLNLVQM